MNQINAVPGPAAVEKPVETIEQIRDTHTSELVIALCGPIGSPIHDVANAFKAALTSDFSYDSAEVLRLSTLIERYKGEAPAGAYGRVKYLIDKGDELRKDHGSEILAELAVSEIALGS